MGALAEEAQDGALAQNERHYASLLVRCWVEAKRAEGPVVRGTIRDLATGAETPIAGLGGVSAQILKQLGWDQEDRGEETVEE